MLKTNQESFLFLFCFNPQGLFAYHCQWKMLHWKGRTNPCACVCGQVWGTLYELGDSNYSSGVLSQWHKLLFVFSSSWDILMASCQNLPFFPVFLLFISSWTVKLCWAACGFYHHHEEINTSWTTRQDGHWVDALLVPPLDASLLWESKEYRSEE